MLQKRYFKFIAALLLVATMFVLGYTLYYMMNMGQLQNQKSQVQNSAGNQQNGLQNQPSQVDNSAGDGPVQVDDSVPNQQNGSQKNDRPVFLDQTACDALSIKVFDLIGNHHMLDKDTLLKLFSVMNGLDFSRVEFSSELDFMRHYPASFSNPKEFSKFLSAHQYFATTLDETVKAFERIADIRNQNAMGAQKINQSIPKFHHLPGISKFLVDKFHDDADGSLELPLFIERFNHGFLRGLREFFYRFADGNMKVSKKIFSSVFTRIDMKDLSMPGTGVYESWGIHD
jgi:hypothetical protein